MCSHLVPSQLSYYQAQYEAEMEQLMAMGFSARKGVQGLRATGGDISAALDWLLQQQEPGLTTVGESSSVRASSDLTQVSVERILGSEDESDISCSDDMGEEAEENEEEGEEEEEEECIGEDDSSDEEASEDEESTEEDRDVSDDEEITFGLHSEEVTSDDEVSEGDDEIDQDSVCEDNIDASDEDEPWLDGTKELLPY